MAVQSDTSSISYTGNNSTSTSYAVPFVFLENAHLKAIAKTSAGVESVVTLTNHTGAGNVNGGTVRTAVAVPATSTLTIYRDVPITQTTTYAEGGDFPAASHERALDKLTQVAQQLDRGLNRTIRFSEAAPLNELPNPPTGKQIIVANNGALGWEPERQVPAYPTGSGTKILTAAGGGASAVWQDGPSIAVGAVTATGSTTPRFLADRFGEVFNVADYGAIGNGIADDTAAIQAAINAAVAAGGGIVRFGANKVYRLNTSTGRLGDAVGRNDSNQMRHFLRIGRADSAAGSTNMMLYFDGQGATLHATSYQTGANDIMYTCCRFHTLVFDNLKFTRAPYNITTSGNHTIALSFYAVDFNQHEQVLIQNCYFKDNLASIDFATWNMNYRQIRGKLKRVDVLNCIFEHDNGANRTAFQYTSGALCVYMNTWVEQARFDRCHADGQTNGQLGSVFTEAMHGFLFPMPLRASVTNCYFTHFIFEVIKASDGETAATGITIAGNFNQVAVGATLSRNITNNDFNVQTLQVGKVYAFYDNDQYAQRRGGFFRLEPKTGGGSYTYAVGETLNFTRVSSAPYHLPSQHEFPVGQTLTTATIGLIDVEMMDQLELSVSNCCFDSKPVKNHLGVDPNPEVESWDFPSILVDYTSKVTNNYFRGGTYNVYCGVTTADRFPIIVANNVFFKYTDRATQSTSNYGTVWVRKANVLIEGNMFIARETRAVTEFLWLAAHDVVVRNNVAIVLNPSSAGSNGVVVPTRFITYAVDLFRITAENNYLKDLEHYARASVQGNIADFTGTLRGSVATIGYPSGPEWEHPSSASIRIAKRFTSPDGGQWTVGVTNDGELEVIK
jgi:hypothetical protein